MSSTIPLPPHKQLCNRYVDLGGRVTTARRTTTRAAPVAAPRLHTHCYCSNSNKQLSISVSPVYRRTVEEEEYVNASKLPPPLFTRWACQLHQHPASPNDPVYLLLGRHFRGVPSLDHLMGGSNDEDGVSLQCQRDQKHTMDRTGNVERSPDSKTCQFRLQPWISRLIRKTDDLASS